MPQILQKIAQIQYEEEEKNFRIQPNRYYPRELMNKFSRVYSFPLVPGLPHPTPNPQCLTTTNYYHLRQRLQILKLANHPSQHPFVWSAASKLALDDDDSFWT